MHIGKVALPILVLLSAASTVGAQGFNLALRGGGGIPLGTFGSSNAEQANQGLLTGAKAGFGYGLDAGLMMGPLGVYAGFDHVQFDCQDPQCGSNGQYTMGGVSAGVRVDLLRRGLIRPWAKGGVTFDNLKGSYGSGGNGTLTTDRRPGYEVAGGIDVPLFGLFAFTPQVRYVGQNARFHIPGVTVTGTQQQSLSFLKVELGLGLAKFGGAPGGPGR